MGIDRERMNAQAERRVARAAERTRVVEALHEATGSAVPLDDFAAFARRVVNEAAPAQVTPGESGERLYLAEFDGRGGGQFVKVGLSGTAISWVGVGGGESRSCWSGDGCCGAGQRLFTGGQAAVMG
ncbi:hypothetical protein ACIQU8_36050 [Streptomyces griseus]|uniref:hypothetical protein n=1 Tax=Streptomyces griseus TaxID=1911 RepID=UPI0038236C8B